MGKVIVQTSCGALSGSALRSIEDYEYYAFKGVPFAKPPVGELRFEDPRPLEHWSGTRDATKFANPCTQFDPFLRSYVGSEDCLYLNVYTKTIDPITPLPVMVFIPGGSFIYGSADDMYYGPDYLIRKDVILVTVNYRVGVFGFLNLEDEVATGNQGLKDQVMALKWIQKDIAKFGGDPNNVTIFGESAGGSCVHYLCLSPMTKGLFHKAISQSGVALNTWASTPSPKKFAYILCKLLGRDTYNSQEIITFLRSVDSMQLVKAQEKLRTSEYRAMLLCPFAPGVDNISPNPFLPKPLLEAAKCGVDVPYLIGYNDREGIFCLNGIKKKTAKCWKETINNSLHPNVANILKDYDVTIDELVIACNVESLSENNYYSKMIEFLQNIYIVHGIHKTAKLQVLNNKSVYLYQYTFDKGTSITKIALNSSLEGASHFDEVPQLFTMGFYRNIGIPPLKEGSDAYKVMEKMTELWTNFAKYGNPTPIISALIPTEWKILSDPVHLTYMEINTELKCKSMLNIDQTLFKNKKVKSDI